jgi:hypothetical protein
MKINLIRIRTLEKQPLEEKDLIGAISLEDGKTVIDLKEDLEDRERYMSLLKTFYNTPQEFVTGFISHGDISVHTEEKAEPHTEKFLRLSLNRLSRIGLEGELME